jgi:hypothetical protein
MKIKNECVFSALEDRSHRMVTVGRHDKWRVFLMKKLALAAAVLTLLSVSANAQYYGKGKAPPPPPVVTKG